VIDIKNFVMSITVSRIIGSVTLLFITPMTALFFVVYGWCAISDMIDGPIARRAKVTSNFGSFLDSSADMLLAIVMLIIFIPILALEIWMIVMVAVVLTMRAVGFTIGFVKYRTFTLLHTYANKAAGTLLACFPIFYFFFGLTITIPILFVAASLSALEELVITIRSKELQRDITSMFSL